MSRRRGFYRDFGEYSNKRGLFKSSRSKKKRSP